VEAVRTADQGVASRHRAWSTAFLVTVAACAWSAWLLGGGHPPPGVVVLLLAPPVWAVASLAVDVGLMIRDRHTSLSRVALALARAVLGGIGLIGAFLTRNPFGAYPTLGGALWMATVPLAVFAVREFRRPPAGVVMAWLVLIVALDVLSIGSDVWWVTAVAGALTLASVALVGLS
jgi:hypothetical protein